MGKLYQFKDPQEGLKDGLKAWRDFATKRYALDALNRRDMVIRHTLVILGVAF